MKDGFGEEKYKDGSIYKGQFKQNMKNGNGKLILAGGGRYEGIFKDDKICGKGKFKFNQKKYYIGDWNNNEISGYGIIFEENIKHIGYYEHNLKQGLGCTFYIEQKFGILGKWQNDFIEGNAILINMKNDNHNNKINLDNEIIVKMKRAEIIKMNLDEDELIIFKRSKDYKDMTKLFYEKFYPDFINQII